ncbi:DNA mismatch repair protein Mlh1 [Malassezia vespertilionis]|nr:DNA mismatch repair protein Mlh1 [Malassezia vespertilionis]WFD07959.1 DNA mismatch repair protein Mlh1 [Malassezia vespertilionis]
MLQIQDNGKGIAMEDFPLLCERFATSKLRKFSDLSSMTTFGFRGEALASISFVSASVSAISKTKTQDVAYSAEYFAGTMKSASETEPAKAKPVAGVDGTTITAYDLFFNAPQRKRVFKSVSEEYNRALDVATKYALHYGHLGVGITCKKASSHSLDLNTPSKKSQTTLDVIRNIYGGPLARDLVHLSELENDEYKFSAQGWISNADWASKKTQFLCFINNRLVDTPSLRRSMESMYSLLLPKGRHPWIYIALTLDPARLDVNVHPTKREVHFMDEEEIVEMITTHAQDLISQQSSCRVYSMTKPSLGVNISENAVQVLGPRTERIDPRNLVRVDHTSQSLDSMFGGATTDTSRIPESTCNLTSVHELRANMIQDRDVGLTNVLQHHTFVGVVDLEKALTLVQHGTQLYLVNHAAVIEAFAYELALRQFGSYTSVALDPAPKLWDLIALGYDAEDAAEAKAALSLSREEVVDRITKRLTDHAEMLHEYFAIHIDPVQKTLVSVPAILPQQAGAGVVLERLPTLLFRLGPQVDWAEEVGCFASVCRELAYAQVPATSGVQVHDAQRVEEEKWMIQHVWFASMLASRGCIHIPKALQDGIVQVASLPELYRVFERC